MCAASLSVVVGDGAAVLLWTDNWAPIGQLCKFAPSLYAATSRAGRKRVLRDALADNQWARDVTGALTVQVVRDYPKVWELLRSVQLHPHQPDRFVWKWTADDRSRSLRPIVRSLSVPPSYSEPRNFGGPRRRRK